jgi:hypothetical protein
MKRSLCANTRRRRFFAVITVLIIASLVPVVTKKSYEAYRRWQNERPILYVEDAYKKVIKVHRTNTVLCVSGPARVWSPKYGLGIWEEKWDYPKFQLDGVAVEFRTKGGFYTVYLQPHGWGEVDRDLRHNVGEITIALE